MWQKQLCKNISKTPEQFKKEFYELSNGEYELLSEYYRSNINVKIKHNLCGKEFEMIPQKYLSGQRCPHCRPNRKRRKRNLKMMLMNYMAMNLPLLENLRTHIQI